MNERRYGQTTSGRKVVVCQCNGQPVHEFKPHGGGAMIFKCPPDPVYVVPATTKGGQ